MADPDPSPETPDQDAAEGFPLPSWKKLGEFVVGVFQLRRSVKDLEEQNRKLRDQIDRLQRQSDEQAGQLKVILGLIDTTISERAARAAETAALQVVQQLLAFRQDLPQPEPHEKSESGKD